MSKQPTKRPRTWESIYYAAIRRGDDPAYALYLADRWQERKGKQREATMPDDIRTPHGAQLDARDALARGRRLFCVQNYPLACLTARLVLW